MIYNLLIGCFAEYDKKSLNIKPIPTMNKKNVKYIEYRINENKELYLNDNNTHSPVNPQTDTPIIANIDESSELYRKFNNKELIIFDDYIKTRTETYQNFKCESLMGYNEGIIDIINDFIKDVNSKQDEIQSYIKLLQNYSIKLNGLITNLNQIVNEHSSKINEMKTNNYKLPKLNTIPKLGILIKTIQDEDTFEDRIILNDNYYYKDNLIIPKTNNPYTEIYILPCNFTELTPKNKRILIKAEKKIALLTIEFDYEYIDLSDTDIQYFIDTFINCPNLKEIRYPNSTEYK